LGRQAPVEDQDLRQRNPFFGPREPVGAEVAAVVVVMADAEVVNGHLNILINALVSGQLTYLPIWTTS
jgi:hypothetical protein